MLKIILIALAIIIIVVLYLLGIHILHLDLILTFLSEASGAAFGGFIGGCVVWLAREGYVHWRKKPKHVVTYFVADNIEEVYGKLTHAGRGERVLGKQELIEKLGSKIKEEVCQNGVWEYKLSMEDHDKSKMAFKGPYRFDLTEPGTYEASFYYFGRGFSDDSMMNQMLFHLDVLLKENVDHHIKLFDNSAKEIDVSKREHKGYQKVITKGKVYLYYRDFVEDKTDSNTGKIARIRFFYNGIGNFEFRAYVPDEPKEAFKNTVDALSKGQIYFYKVEINRIFNIEIPEAI